MLKTDSGLTTIEQAREQFKRWYKHESSLFVRIMLKCWINHSGGRHRNNNKPFTFHNYELHMRTIDCIEQIRLDMIDVNDLGGKDLVMSLLASGLTR